MKKSKSKAGMAGKDNFTEHRTSPKKSLPKPSKFGGTKNSTYIRPQPK